MLGASLDGNDRAPAPVDGALEERIFRELSRTPEVETRSRDAWGNWDFSFGQSNLRGELYVPWLDRPLADLRRRLAAEHSGPRLEPLWPDGKPFAVCLTHDVDVVTQNPSASSTARALLRDTGLLFSGPRDRASREAAFRSVLHSKLRLLTLRAMRPSRERTYDEWLELEARHGFKSTFFYFPTHVSDAHVYDCTYSFDDTIVYDGRRMRVREMMREMARAGWEVGLHGSYHSALRPGLLAAQKREVEDALGGAVTSTRQHWLHYDVRVTPKLQADAGLLADSTQGFNRNVGFRAGTAFPYFCWDFDRGDALPVLEVPQHVMDGALFTPNALEYDVDLAVRHCVQLMDAVEDVGGCLTLSWHPNVIEYPAYWSVYETVLGEAARRNAWGCSMGELRRWWTERAARIAANKKE